MSKDTDILREPLLAKRTYANEVASNTLFVISVQLDTNESQNCKIIYCTYQNSEEGRSPSEGKSLAQLAFAGSAGIVRGLALLDSLDEDKEVKEIYEDGSSCKHGIELIDVFFPDYPRSFLANRLAKVTALQDFYSKISNDIESIYSFHSKFSVNLTYGGTKLKYIVKLKMEKTSPKREDEDPAIKSRLEEAATDLGMHFYESGLLSQFEIMDITGSVEITSPIFLGCCLS